MTDLDDALNKSNPLLGGVKIRADWKELPPGYSPGATTVDDIRDLGTQVGPNGYTISHSFEDALPDPVTMTGSNDASGQLEAELVGRDAKYADVTTFKTPMTGGSGSAVTSITMTPNNVAANDLALIGVILQGSGITITKTDQDPLDPNSWVQVGQSIDGSLQLLVFAKTWHSGASGITLTLSGSVTNYVWGGVGIAAATHAPASSAVSLRVGGVVSAIETVNQQPHTIPNVSLTKRGYIVGFWASIISIGWGPNGDQVELSETASNPRLMISRTPLRTGKGTETLVATTQAVTDSVAMLAIPVEIMDRPRMDATQYFSPFNLDSPVYGYERDTAPVQVNLPVITANGPVDTQIFSGQMSDIGVSGRTAKLNAISKTRIDLDRQLVLPSVYSYRAGLTVDWLATWVMARGGQYAGPSCSAYTRWWIPFYGSMTPSFGGGPLYFANGNRYTSTNPGVAQTYRPPTEIAGPFVSAMFAQYKNDLVLEVNCVADRAGHPNGATELGFDPIATGTNDLMTKASNKGRVSFWLRGDAAANPSAAVVGAPAFTNTLFRYRLVANSSIDTNLGEFGITIREDRRIQLTMGGEFDGVVSGIVNSTELPTDGLWHYYCICYDWDANVVNIRIDNSTFNPTPGWATTTTGPMYDNEVEMYADGGYNYQAVWSRVPISDFQVEGGPAAFAEGTSGRFWPTLSGTAGNAKYRRTGQWIEAVADNTPVQGWSLLAELAQASLASYRVDETDSFNFFDLSYFGETAQLTSSAIEDTQVNAGDLDVKNDPTKTRNVVTLEFPETRVDTKYQRILNLTSAILIPQGVSYFLFPTDVPIVELNGIAAPYTGSIWTITKLTEAQTNAPATIPANTHFMTVNALEAGSNVQYTGSAFSARIASWDSSGVTIKFTNTYWTPLWLSNDAQDVPFLSLVGLGVTQNTSYTTQRDSGSINKRRERALTTSNRWIHNRSVAVVVAGKLVNMLSRPRAEVTVEVMGDPRRKPGQMVTLKDSESTQAAGTWRILSVEHNGNGPQYTQILQLVQVYPSTVWDSQTGWDEAIWVA